MTNTKISNLPALTTMEDSDLFLVVDDPTGEAASKKITKANVLTDVTTHMNDATKHYLVGSISHAAITNIGTNTHAEIDTHIASASIHFTEVGTTQLSATGAASSTTYLRGDNTWSTPEGGGTSGGWETIATNTNTSLTDGYDFTGIDSKYVQLRLTITGRLDSTTANPQTELRMTLNGASYSRYNYGVINLNTGSLGATEVTSSDYAVIAFVNEGESINLVMILNNNSVTYASWMCDCVCGYTSATKGMGELSTPAVGITSIALDSIYCDFEIGTTFTLEGMAP